MIKTLGKYSREELLKFAKLKSGKNGEHLNYCLTPSQASLSPRRKVIARSLEIFFVFTRRLQPVFPV